jgi:hypothetical protein
MFGRKNKQLSEQDSRRRQVQHGDGASSAFSYYTSRVSERPAARPSARRKDPEQPKAVNEPSRRLARSVSADISFLLLVIVIVICLGKILALSDNPKIVIVGETATSSHYLQPISTYQSAAHKLLMGSITDRTKLTIDTEEISRAFQQEFPEVQDVSISIPLVNSRPVVFIQPTNPSVLVESTQNDYYALNASGIVLTALSGTTSSSLPLVIDQSGLVPVVGKQLLSSDTIEFVQTVVYQFTAAHLGITSFSLPAAAPYELDAHLAGKPYIVRFNLEEDSLTQSGAAIATIQQLGATVPTSYIDMRVPGRVYYK